MCHSGYSKEAAPVATALVYLLLLFSIPVPAFAQQITAETDLFRYPGSLLGGVTSAEVLKSLDDCRKLCLERSGCVGFDHQTPSLQCRLFAVISSARSLSNSNAETRTPIAGYRPPTQPLREDKGKTPQRPSDVLEIDDRSAQLLLRTMAAEGDLKSPQHSEAWTVLSTVAWGMGLEKCGFATPGDSSIFWKPALERMTPDQIMVLNRLVTANFRTAETDMFVNLDQLFPITRQAVIFLSDGKTKWNCEEIAGVWEAATNYYSARNGK